MPIARIALVCAVVALTMSSCAAPVGDAVGTWGSPAAHEPHLTLAKDGSFSGSDGCNRLTGEWSEKNGAIAFGKVASTLMACEGVDTWLSQLDRASIDGDTMHVRDRSDTEIGTLERQ